MPLPLKILPVETLSIPGHDRWYADETDPALSVMTDFRERPSVVVAASAPIDEALEHMKHTGVRCAFVVDETSNVVVGMITAYDVSGERPMQIMLSADTPRSGIRVRDLMQPIREWRVADVRDLEGASVGDVARLFAESGRTHIAVMESMGTSEPRLRGLLSAAKVRRLLSR